MTVSQIPFYNARASNADILAELTAAATRVIESGHYILGPEVQAFEHAMAESLTWGATPGVAVGVSCGTDALILALRACGVGPGDEVIVPAFTFVAPASAVVWAGATPVFADVDPVTFCLDPVSVKACLSPKTKAVIAVHLFGCPAHIGNLREALADAPQPVAIVEDLAQAWGAVHAGQSVGTIGDVGAVSFFPTKNLGGLGDGGAIIAPADRIKDLLSLRQHGCRVRDYHSELGLNARLDPLQAAMLQVKLRGLPSVLDLRYQQAEHYAHALADLDWIQTPTFDTPEGDTRTFNQFVLRVPEERDALRQHLTDHHVHTRTYYPMPLPSQPIFAELDHPLSSWPVTEQACRETLALPLGEGLDAAKLDQVVDTIRSFRR